MYKNNKVNFLNLKWNSMGLGYCKYLTIKLMLSRWNCWLTCSIITRSTVLNYVAISSNIKLIFSKRCFKRNLRYQLYFWNGIPWWKSPIEGIFLYPLFVHQFNIWSYDKITLEIKYASISSTKSKKHLRYA